MGATGTVVEVTAQSVMRWIRKPDISEVKEIEMDEMYHYY